MSYDQYGQSGQQNNPQGWGGNEGEQNPWSNPQEQGTSQPSANYPASQPSAGYPGGQPSEAYPGSQPSADYLGSQAPAAYGYDAGQQATQQPQQGWTAQQGQPTQQFPAQQGTDSGWGASSVPAAPTGPQQKGLFGTLFDFSFTDYATPALAKVLYILGIVLGGLAWLGGPAQIFLASSAMSPFGSISSTFAVLALFALIIGLVPLAFWIIGLRMGLEFVLATVRTQQDTAAMRATQDQQNT